MNSMHCREAEEFQAMVRQMLGDMKQFKLVSTDIVCIVVSWTAGVAEESAADPGHGDDEPGLHRPGRPGGARHAGGNIQGRILSHKKKLQ